MDAGSQPPSSAVASIARENTNTAPRLGLGLGEVSAPVALLGVPPTKQNLDVTKMTVDSKSWEVDGNAAHAASSQIHSGYVFMASVDTKSAGVAPLRTLQALPRVAVVNAEYKKSPEAAMEHVKHCVVSIIDETMRHAPLIKTYHQVRAAMVSRKRILRISTTNQRPLPFEVTFSSPWAVSFRERGLGRCQGIQRLQRTLIFAG